MGEGAAESNVEPPERRLDVEHLFQELDGNKDGCLDRRELEVCHLCPTLLIRFSICKYYDSSGASAL